jgi:hypothetical protein
VAQRQRRRTFGAGQGSPRVQSPMASRQPMPRGRARPDARHLRHFTRKCRMAWHPGRRQYITVARCENVSRGDRSRNRHRFLLANAEVYAATRSRRAFLAPRRSCARRWRSRPTRGSPRTPWDQSPRRSSRSPSVHTFPLCSNRVRRKGKSGVPDRSPARTIEKAYKNIWSPRRSKAIWRHRCAQAGGHAASNPVGASESGSWPRYKIARVRALRLGPIGSIRRPASFNCCLRLPLAIQLPRFKLGTRLRPFTEGIITLRWRLKCRLLACS